MGGVGNTKVSVVEINDARTHITLKKIPNISTYHLAEATDTGLKVWQYFGIGPGKHISFIEEAVFSSGHTVISKFATPQKLTLTNISSTKPKLPRLDRGYASEYFCSDQDCVSFFFHCRATSTTYLQWRT